MLTRDYELGDFLARDTKLCPMGNLDGRKGAEKLAEIGYEPLIACSGEQIIVIVVVVGGA